jgi:hypothetical protein
MVIENSYGLWVMGYGYNFPANQLGKSKKVCLTREYGLYLVSVRRESTVAVTQIRAAELLLGTKYTVL